MTFGGVPDLRLPRRTHGVLAWSAWDLVSLAAALAHVALIVWLVAGFSHRPWWANLLGGLAYAYAIAWNINGVAHNFVHTPFFRQPPLNYLFSLLLSIEVGYPQTFYRWVHLRHHQGNSDRIGPDGTTVDWLSIYRYGRNGRPEGPWSYVFKSFFRDDLGDVHAVLRTRRPFDAAWGRFEQLAFVVFVLGMALIDWKAVIFLAPFYYLGECASQLNGYYEHFNGDPDEPMAWGVSTYAPLYNWAWFNNGHHAEHHFRPAVHWTRLPTLRRALEPEFRRRGGHVIETAHMLGFLAPANHRQRAANSAPGASF